MILIPYKVAEKYLGYGMSGNKEYCHKWTWRKINDKCKYLKFLRIAHINRLPKILQKSYIEAFYRYWLVPYVALGLFDAEETMKGYDKCMRGVYNVHNTICNELARVHYSRNNLSTFAAELS